MRRYKTLLLVGALMLLSAALATGCDAQQAEQPAAPPQNAADPADQGAPDASVDNPEGERLVSEKCTGCHDLTRVNAVSRDRAGWETTVSRMEGHGLEINAYEREAILVYLAQRN
jgi:cytochrome c5